MKPFPVIAARTSIRSGEYIDKKIATYSKGYSIRADRIAENREGRKESSI